ncbi:MAG TPA: DUF2069 domain-containing protein [Steroidobacteraceae bacterium]|nr:DUF2069 domain-containing protein [Steroidobacteraceae bacterium]
MNVPADGSEPSIARRLRLAAVLATMSVVALIVSWVVIAPSTARMVGGAVLALPFAIGAPFLYAGRRRAYGWLTLALAPSLVLGLMEAVAVPATRAWSALFVFVLLATFVLFVAYLRATRSSSQP